MRNKAAVFRRLEWDWVGGHFWDSRSVLRLGRSREITRSYVPVNWACDQSRGLVRESYNAHLVVVVSHERFALGGGRPDIAPKVGSGPLGSQRVIYPHIARE